MTQTINFNLCAHISNRLLHKTILAFFLIISCSFFIAIIRRVLKHIFHENSEKLIIQKILERKKIAGTVLFVSWLAIYQWKKIIENCNSVGAGAHKVGKVVSFWSNFDHNFTDIWRAKKRQITFSEKGRF